MTKEAIAYTRRADMARTASGGGESVSVDGRRDSMKVVKAVKPFGIFSVGGPAERHSVVSTTWTPSSPNEVRVEGRRE